MYKDSTTAQAQLHDEEHKQDCLWREALWKLFQRILPVFRALVRVSDNNTIFKMGYSWIM